MALRGKQKTEKTDKKDLSVALQSGLKYDDHEGKCMFKECRRVQYITEATQAFI